MELLEALKECGYKDIAAELEVDDKKRRDFIRVMDDMYLRGSKEQFLSFCSKFWDIADKVYNEEDTNF